MKFWYSSVSSDSLIFLLWPTNTIAELITNSDGIYLQGTGYYHDALNIVINKSCSGFNFMALCFLMISFLGKKFVYKRPLILLPLSLILAYPLTLFANSSRILLSILLESITLETDKPVWFHQAEGIFIYLFFLVIIYFVVEFFLTNQKFRHAQTA
jgi:exosortase K